MLLRDSGAHQVGEEGEQSGLRQHGGEHGDVSELRHELEVLGVGARVGGQVELAGESCVLSGRLGRARGEEPGADAWGESGKGGEHGLAEQERGELASHVVELSAGGGD